MYEESRAPRELGAVLGCRFQGFPRVISSRPLVPLRGVDVGWALLLPLLWWALAARAETRRRWRGVTRGLVFERRVAGQGQKRH